MITAAALEYPGENKHWIRIIRIIISIVNLKVLPWRTVHKSTRQVTSTKKKNSIERPSRGMNHYIYPAWAQCDTRLVEMKKLFQLFLKSTTYTPSSALIMGYFFELCSGLVSTVDESVTCSPCWACFSPLRTTLLFWFASIIFIFIQMESELVPYFHPLLLFLLCVRVKIAGDLHLFFFFSLSPPAIFRPSRLLRGDVSFHRVWQWLCSLVCNEL